MAEKPKENPYKEWKVSLSKNHSRTGRVLEKLKLERSIDMGKKSDLEVRIAEKGKQIDTQQLVYDEMTKMLSLKCGGGLRM